MLYSATLTFMFKVKYFLVANFLQKCADCECPRQSFLDWHGPAMELLLLFAVVVGATATSYSCCSLSRCQLWTERRLFTGCQCGKESNLKVCIMMHAVSAAPARNTLKIFWHRSEESQHAPTFVQMRLEVFPFKILNQNSDVVRSLSWDHLSVTHDRLTLRTSGIMSA